MSDFNESEKAAIYRVIAERRDMRHFLPDPVSPELLARLLQAAHLAPSVGYMQPWRFIRIVDRDLRTKIHALVETERISTAAALAEREDEFMRLKVEGILECGELLVVALAQLGQAAGGGDVPLEAGRPDRPGQDRLPHFLRPLSDGTQRSAGEDDEEFLAAEAGQHVGLAGLAPQDVRHMLERFVPHPQAVRVVESLEQVEVEQQ